MTGAPCPNCGGQVMQYRRYATYLRPTAVCEACGTRVTQGIYYWVALVGGLAILALLLYTIPRDGSLGVVLPLTVLALGVALDLLWYARVPWHQVSPPPPTEGLATARSAAEDAPLS